MEHKTLELKFSVDSTGSIEGYASVFGPPADRFGDVIARGAFSRTLEEHRAAGTVPLMLWQHDPDQPIGTWIDIAEDDRGLKVRGRLVLDTERGREAYALLKAGAMNGLSIGYRVRSAANTGARAREIQDVELVEVSLVSLPAQQRARVTSVKSAAMGAADYGVSVMEDETQTMETEQTAAPETKSVDVNQAIESLKSEIKTEIKSVSDRQSEIERVMRRPGVTTTDHKSEGESQRKAFTTFLRKGIERMEDLERKQLVVGTDADGGYLVPETFLQEMLREIVLFSPVRQVARVTQTGGSEVKLPKRTGTMTAQWVSETGNRTGTQPEYGQNTYGVHEMGAYVDISNVLLEDSAFDMASELARDFAEEFGRLESAAFVNGDASGKPEGFMQNTDVGSVDTASAGEIAADDIIDLYHAIKTAYARNGAWGMNRATMAVVRKLKASDGHYLWQDSLSEGNPPTLLGRPVVEMPDLADVAAGAEPIVFGDFNRGYRIFDRVNLTVLRDPYSVQTNGQVRFHARRRVGGGVALAEAIAKLAVTTA